YNPHKSKKNWLPKTSIKEVSHYIYEITDDTEAEHIDPEFIGYDEVETKPDQKTRKCRRNFIIIKS
ncbi:MAG: hypothetical protein ABIK22_07155, partial [candidate division WOR-3 bacterium]